MSKNHMPQRYSTFTESVPRSHAFISLASAGASVVGRGIARRSKWESCFSSETNREINRENPDESRNYMINNDPFVEGVDVRSHNRGEKYDEDEIQNTGRNTERWMGVDRIYEEAELKNRRNVSMQQVFTLALGAPQEEQSNDAHRERGGDSDDVQQIPRHPLRKRHQRQFSSNPINVMNYSISQHTNDSPYQTVDRLGVEFTNDEDSISDHGGSTDISLERGPHEGLRLMDYIYTSDQERKQGSDAQAGNERGEILTDVTSNDNGIEVYKKSETDDSGCNSILRNQDYNILKSYVAQKNEELSIPSDYNTADPCSVRGSIESETMAPLKESTGKPKDMKIKKLHDTSFDICNEDDEGLVYFEPSESDEFIIEPSYYSNTSQLGDGLSVDSVEVRNRSESDTIGEENNTIDGVIEGNNGILLPLAATEDLNDSKKRVDGRNIPRDSGHINEFNSSDDESDSFVDVNEIFASLGLGITKRQPSFICRKDRNSSSTMNESTIKNYMNAKKSRCRNIYLRSPPARYIPYKQIRTEITSRRLPIKKDKSLEVEDRHLSMERREEIEDSLIDGYDERPIFNDLQSNCTLTVSTSLLTEMMNEMGLCYQVEDVTAPTEKLSKEDIRHVVEEILMEKEKREAAKITPQSRTHSHERAEASQFDFQSVLYESGGLDKSHDANMKGNSPSWHSTPARFHQGPVIQCERVQDDGVMERYYRKRGLGLKCDLTFSVNKGNKGNKSESVMKNLQVQADSYLENHIRDEEKSLCSFLPRSLYNKEETNSDYLPNSTALTRSSISYDGSVSNSTVPHSSPRYSGRQSDTYMKVCDVDTFDKDNLGSHEKASFSVSADVDPVRLSNTAAGAASEAAEVVLNELNHDVSNSNIETETANPVALSSFCIPKDTHEEIDSPDSVITDMAYLRENEDIKRIIQEETHKALIEVQLSQAHDLAMRSMQEEDMELQRIKEDEERLHNVVREAAMATAALLEENREREDQLMQERRENIEKIRRSRELTTEDIREIVTDSALKVFNERKQLTVERESKEKINDLRKTSIIGLLKSRRGSVSAPESTTYGFECTEPTPVADNIQEGIMTSFDIDKTDININSAQIMIDDILNTNIQNDAIFTKCVPATETHYDNFLEENILPRLRKEDVEAVARETANTIKIHFEEKTRQIKEANGTQMRVVIQQVSNIAAMEILNNISDPQIGDVEAIAYEAVHRALSESHEEVTPESKAETSNLPTDESLNSGEDSILSNVEKVSPKEALIKRNEQMINLVRHAATLAAQEVIRQQQDIRTAQTRKEQIEMEIIVSENIEPLAKQAARNAIQDQDNAPIMPEDEDSADLDDDLLKEEEYQEHPPVGTVNSPRQEDITLTTQQHLVNSVLGEYNTSTLGKNLLVDSEFFDSVLPQPKKIDDPPRDRAGMPCARDTPPTIQEVYGPISVTRSMQLYHHLTKSQVRRDRSMAGIKSKTKYHQNVSAARKSHIRLPCLESGHTSALIEKVHTHPLMNDFEASITSQINADIITPTRNAASNSSGLPSVCFSSTISTSGISTTTSRTQQKDVPIVPEAPSVSDKLVRWGNSNSNQERADQTSNLNGNMNSNRIQSDLSPIPPNKTTWARSPAPRIPESQSLSGYQHNISVKGLDPFTKSPDTNEFSSLTVPLMEFRDSEASLNKLKAQYYALKASSIRKKSRSKSRSVSNLNLAVSIDYV